MEKKYPDVEVVAAPLIKNKKGEILLIKSPKWGDAYLIPGGHVERGETVFHAAAREGEEETGLTLKPLYCINIEELIDDPSYHRKAHLISFHILCEATSDAVKLDPSEVNEHLWISPEEALKLALVSGMAGTLRNYLAGTKIDIASF